MKKILSVVTVVSIFVVSGQEGYASDNRPRIRLPQGDPLNVRPAGNRPNPNYLNLNAQRGLIENGNFVPAGGQHNSRPYVNRNNNSIRVSPNGTVSNGRRPYVSGQNTSPNVRTGNRNFPTNGNVINLRNSGRNIPANGRTARPNNYPTRLNGNLVRNNGTRPNSRPNGINLTRNGGRINLNRVPVGESTNNGSGRGGSGGSHSPQYVQYQIAPVVTTESNFRVAQHLCEIVVQSYPQIAKECNDAVNKITAQDVFHSPTETSQGLAGTQLCYALANESDSYATYSGAYRCAARVKQKYFRPGQNNPCPVRSKPSHWHGVKSAVIDFNWTGDHGVKARKNYDAKLEMQRALNCQFQNIMDQYLRQEGYEVNAAEFTVI